MNQIFARFRTTEPLTRLHPSDAPSAPWEKPMPEEEATAEPPRLGLLPDQPYSYVTFGIVRTHGKPRGTQTTRPS